MAVLAAVLKKPYEIKDIEPYVSLIIPAHNEEKVIADKLNNALSLDYPRDKFEILLILDGCIDKTKAIAAGYKDSRLKLIEQNPRKGKMAALNLAVPQAKGDIVVFTDANSLYEKDAIRKLVRNFADKRIGCVCGELKYRNESLVGEGEDLYWKYEKFIKTNESRLYSLLVVNGSIYAIRKDLFEPVEETLADDFVVPMVIAKKGYGLVYEPEAVTLEKTAASTKEGISQKARIIAQGLKAGFAVGRIIVLSGPLRLFQFLFHKFIRWFVPVFLIIMFLSNIFLLNEPFYKVIFLCQGLFYIFAAIGHLLEKNNVKIGIFKIPLYFCVVNLASAIGIIKFLTGGIKATWEKAETTRG
ncbi:MAG: glycosyltransferase family 2 protein [Candidatus Omnitrophica bacterium]|nr:glycosyltransferase family 2 protein [Candidatus Omnitrophota bacterium]MDD5546264.1 glycosyltransferase family 2 protein [Candidatus Omnitrophota bacterium]